MPIKPLMTKLWKFTKHMNGLSENGSESKSWIEYRVTTPKLINVAKRAGYEARDGGYAVHTLYLNKRLIPTKYGWLAR